MQILQFPCFYRSSVDDCSSIESAKHQLIQNSVVLAVSLCAKCHPSAALIIDNVLLVLWSLFTLSQSLSLCLSLFLSLPLIYIYFLFSVPLPLIYIYFLFSVPFPLIYIYFLFSVPLPDIHPLLCLIYKKTLKNFLPPPLPTPLPHLHLHSILLNVALWLNRQWKTPLYEIVMP